MQPKNLWSLAYHLSGVTLLGATEQEPLGPLPYPVRTAVLQLAQQLEPDALDVKLRRETLNYLGGEYTYVDYWRFRDEHLERRLTSRRRSPTQTFGSIEAYYQHYNLRRKSQDGTDVHFAERLFIERSFVPAFGVRALQFLQPQVPFIDSEGRERRIDFVIEGSKPYALEVEGAAYHAKNRISGEKFEDEKKRQAELGVHGFTYVPFTFASLTNDYALAVLNELSLEDKVLGRLAKSQWNKRERPDSADVTGLPELELLFRVIPDRFQTYQQLCLTLLWRAFEAGEGVLNIGDYAPRLPLLSIAMLDTVALLERVAELYQLPAALPTVNLYIIGQADKLHTDLLALYLGCKPGEGDGRTDASFTSVDIHHVPFMPQGVAFAHVSKAESEARDAPLAACGFDALERLVAPFLKEAGSAPPLDAKPASFERPLLDYFARRYFPYHELRPEQIQLTQRALREESGLGILPTGFGKSAIFQLYALLSSRTTLIISPLKALMRDQVHALKQRGILAVDAISSTDTPSEKDTKLRAFVERRYRMLYVSPERLQIKSFYNELRASMESTPIGALVIDEAHCVSEWGHDFRPAYLQIAPLRKALEEASGRPVPLIGLTATASPVVRRDIVNMLELPSDSVVQLSSSDRPNLSLSVHSVADDSIGAKDQTVKRLIEEHIPRALGMSFDELLPIGQEPPFEHTGVVFSIYANPHGRTTLQEGVHGIADFLQRNVTHDKNLVQVHASSTPTVCPECESPLFTSASKRVAQEVLGDPEANTGNDSYICLDCHQFFSRYKYVPNWEETLLARQDDFKDSQFPILVATKGYGMGVDKRNIRFIIHHALSGGFEGYYQEAGRAGRDGKQSHVALVYAPPTPACYNEHLKGFRPPPCVTDARNRRFHKCPYGLSGLCDYGRQAHFIAGDYRGIDEDLALVMSVYESIEAGETITAQEKDDGIKNTQLAFYRLQQLGVITGYSLEYKSLRKVQFEVEKPEKLTRDQVKQNVASFLSKTRAARKQVEEQLAKLDRRRVRTDKTAKHYDLVEIAARIVLERVYAEVPRMRYQMLTSQLDYATSSERGECRRIKIRSEFDDGVALEDYRCGFCDVCQPDLAFKRDRAEVPTKDAQVEDIALGFPQVLEEFDTEELPSIVKTISNKGAVQGMFYKASNTLEGDPTNLSTLYLAGALGRRTTDFRERALEYLRFGYQEVERQGKGKDGLRLMYWEAAHIHPKLAFTWIEEEGGAFDNRQGLKFIQAEAENTFGKWSDEARNIQALRRIRGFRSMSKDISNLATGLEALNQQLANTPELQR